MITLNRILNQQKAMLRIITILVLYTSCSFFANACTCAGLAPITSNEVDQAGAIFVGRVVEIKPDRSIWRKAVTFEVLEPLKLSDHASTITIWTPLDEAACGLGTEVGQDWYVFADRDETGMLHASLCGRSVHINKKIRVFAYGLSETKYQYQEKRYWKKDRRRYRNERRFVLAREK